MATSGGPPCPGPDSLPHPVPRIPLLKPLREMESFTSPLDRRSEAYRHIAAQEAASQPSTPRSRQPLLNLPNILTLLRLFMVPLMLLLWELKWWHWSPITAAGVFILASLTDWLDGYLARRLKITTVFGAFLDPVADKVMVCTSLILLSSSPPPPIAQGHMLLPVSIMISREITMSALREWAAAAGGAAHKAVKVNSFGKWKTALQMVAMSTLLVLRQPFVDLVRVLPAPLNSPEVLTWTSMGAFAMLWAATGLAAWSLAIYLSNVWSHFIYPHAKSH